MNKYDPYRLKNNAFNFQNKQETNKFAASVKICYQKILEQNKPENDKTQKLIEQDVLLLKQKNYVLR